MSKTFSLNIDTINGVVQEFPQLMYFRCDQITPVGMTIVRYFNTYTMCQYAHKTFYLLYKSELFGTQQFKTFEDYNNFRFWHCCDTEIILLVNGCNLTINGMNLNLN